MTTTPPQTGSGRGRGRPSIGKPVTSRLSDEDHAFALALGDGGDALGIRRAVKIVANMGLKVAKELSRNLENTHNEVEKSTNRVQITKAVPKSKSAIQTPTVPVHLENHQTLDLQPPVTVSEPVANDVLDVDTDSEEQHSETREYLRHGT